VTAALWGTALGSPEGLDPSLPRQDLALIDTVLREADVDASKRLQSWSWVDLADLELRPPTPNS
jgi:hypothetical protein